MVYRMLQEDLYELFVGIKFYMEAMEETMDYWSKHYSDSSDKYHP